MQDSREYSSPKVLLKREEFLVVFTGSMAFSREMHAARERRNPAVGIRGDRKRATTCRKGETARESTCLALSPISLRGIGEPSVCFWNSRTIQTSFLLSARRELDGSKRDPRSRDGRDRLGCAPIGAFRRELSALLYRHHSLRESLFNRLYDKLRRLCASCFVVLKSLY